MTDFKTIDELMRYNEDVARKFFEIEKRILTILNYTDLLKVLLTEIQVQFKMPYAWISLIEKSEISSFIQTLASSEDLRHRLNIIGKKDFSQLIKDSTRPLLVNDDLKPYYKLLPPNRKYFFKSLAIAPISLDGEVIGSLNQADVSQKRFQPGIDTSLLERLAVKVSLCLSNVTAHEKLRFLAYHDPLTGLLNRRVMTSVLEREFSRATRYMTRLSVVFVDLDRFKEVNDRYGHDVGDELLRYVADVLKDRCRNTDIVARYAGDEFVIILPETDKDSAEAMMQRMQAHLARHPLHVDNLIIPVSISFGIAGAEEKKATHPDVLLKNADEALYSKKKARKKKRSPKKRARSSSQQQKVIEWPQEDNDGDTPPP
jgi:diguanylate cyclase (GGDEF)-like protein